MCHVISRWARYIAADGLTVRRARDMAELVQVLPLQWNVIAHAIQCDGTQLKTVL